MRPSSRPAAAGRFASSALAAVAVLGLSCSSIEPADAGRSAAEAGERPADPGGYLGFGTWAEFPASPGAAAPSAVDLCGAPLCAGLGVRPLNPAFMPFEQRPRSAALRLISGEDGFPLGGYGARLSTNPFRYWLRTAFDDQYYSRLFLPAEGTHDPTLPGDVKALVLVDERGERIVWLRADLIAIPLDLRGALVSELRRRGHLAIHDGNLLVHATHTHAGFGGLSPRSTAPLGMDRFSAPIFEGVVAQMADAVDHATATLAAARVGVGRGEAPGLGHNRRWNCEDEGDAPNTEPDPEVGVLRIDRADGSGLATVFNYAIHGVSLPPENMRFSPDNMGYAEARVRAAGGGEGFFLNGAEGDVNPTGDALAIGEALGAEVVDVWRSIETTGTVELASAHCRNDDAANEPSYASPCPGVFAFAQLRIGKSIPSSSECFGDRGADRSDGWLDVTWDKSEDLSALEREGVPFGAFGLTLRHADRTERLVVTTLPGEPITDIGYAIKRPLAERYDHTWVVGLANAHVGYIVTEEEFLQGGYESALNAFGADEGRIAVGNALHLVERLDDAARSRRAAHTPEES